MNRATSARSSADADLEYAVSILFMPLFD